MPIRVKAGTKRPVGGRVALNGRVLGHGLDDQVGVGEQREVHTAGGLLSDGVAHGAHLVVVPGDEADVCPVVEGALDDRDREGPGADDGRYAGPIFAAA